MQHTVQQATATEAASYAGQGFVLVRGVLRDTDFSALETRFLQLINTRSGGAHASLRDPALVSKICQDRSLETHVYDAIRQYPELVDLSLTQSLVRAVAVLLGGRSLVLLEKIVLRIDCPLVTRELAIWHQDHFYVKGDIETITAWIPLQDTGFREGCLMVMPGSHRDGLLAHDTSALGKKYYPSTIFGREVRYVEMHRGDVLLFHSCLLHSSGINISDTIRFSVQARYLCADAISDASMGKRIAIP
jgi:ectoine hydroxylase-related dioxygenase (phytanoyl-CoA dioxygenase family)